MPSRPLSVRRFASFFRSYGYSLGVVVAALPVLFNAVDLLEYYESQRGFITFLASLVSYLSVASVFGARKYIGRIVYPEQRGLDAPSYYWRISMGFVAPTVLAIAAVLSFVIFMEVTASSIDTAAYRNALIDRPFAGEESNVSQEEGTPVDQVLEELHAAEELERRVAIPAQLFGQAGQENRVFVAARSYGRSYNWDLSGLTAEGQQILLSDTPLSEIPHRFWIAAWYVAGFALAASSFVWSGTVEYVETELNLDDHELIRDPYFIVESTNTPTPSVE